MLWEFVCGDSIVSQSRFGAYAGGGANATNEFCQIRLPQYMALKITSPLPHPNSIPSIFHIRVIIVIIMQQLDLLHCLLYHV